METRVESFESNGYKMNPKTRATVAEWKRYLLEALGDQIKEFRVFLWSAHIAFLDVKLWNGHYGQFNASPKSVHFNGHTCSDVEYRIFTHATLNDECYDSKLFTDHKEAAI